MKLRLQSNSIRLRLRRGEVDQLAKLGRVEEKIVIGSGDDSTLVYALQSSPKVFAPQATLDARSLLVEVPIEQVQHWASSDDIGIEAEVAVGNGTRLQILIEKDFACLNGDEEQNRDTFPNPLAGTKC